MPKRKWEATMSEKSDEALEVLWKMCRANELYTYEMFKDDLTTWFRKHSTLFPSEPKNRLERPLSCEDCSIDTELSSLKARMEVGEIEKIISFGLGDINWEKDWLATTKTDVRRAATAVVKHLRGA